VYVPPAQSVSFTEVTFADVHDTGDVQLFAPLRMVHVGVDVNDAVAITTVDVATVVVAFVDVAVVVAWAFASIGIRNNAQSAENNSFFIVY
jgi:hypothetical protein